MNYDEVKTTGLEAALRELGPDDQVCHRDVC